MMPSLELRTKDLDCSIKQGRASSSPALLFRKNGIYFFFLLTTPARAAIPDPNRIMVAGSGTGAGDAVITRIQSPGSVTAMRTVIDSRSELIAYESRPSEPRARKAASG